MALDFPASPTNGQAYGSYTYDSTLGAWRSKGVAQAATYVSASAPSGPVSGDMWYNTNDGTTYVFYNDGDTAQWVELRSEVATSQVGLVPVVPSSVVVGSGSASSGTTGLVTFTGASSVSLNSVFTSGYSNYRVLVKVTYSNVQQAILLRLRTSGADKTANYYWGGSIGYVTGTTSPYNLNNGGYQIVGYTGANSLGLTSSSTDILSPALATTTQFMTTGVGHDGNAFSLYVAGQHYDQTAHESLTLYGSGGSMNGTIQVYGYK